jgi:uncharacterized protein YwqG
VTIETVLPVLLAAVVLAAVALAVRALQRTVKLKRDVAEAKRRTEEWQVADPRLPVLTDDEFEAFREWYATQALPAAMLTIGDPVAPAATGSHIGGRVVWPASKPWPAGRDGQPLQFLAQLDFATLPPIPDFPQKGVLQFFIGSDDLYGADFDNPLSGSFRVEWWADGVIGGKATMSPKVGEDDTPLSPELKLDARRLEGVPADVHPPAFTLPVDRHPGQVMERENAQRVLDEIQRLTAGETGRHRIGGHPEFTQHDFREDSDLDGYDRVLLQLWSAHDGGLMWGDMGQGNFMIRREDLLARDFSRVTYHWDCS